MTKNKAVYGRHNMHQKREMYFFKGDEVRSKVCPDVYGFVAATPQNEYKDTVLIIVPEIRKSPIRYPQSEWEKV